MGRNESAAARRRNHCKLKYAIAPADCQQSGWRNGFAPPVFLALKLGTRGKEFHSFAVLNILRQLCHWSLCSGMQHFAGNLGQRNQDEGALQHPGVGDLQVRSLPVNDEAAKQQNIYVDVAGSVPDGSNPPHVIFDGLNRGQQPAGFKEGLDCGGDVEKPGLLRKTPRFRFIDRGAINHPDAAGGVQ